MKEFDYLLDLDSVKWEKDYDESRRTLHDKGFRNLDSNYLCDVLFMERIAKKAKELGYIHEYTLNTLDVEEHDYNRPPYEKLWVYSKTDEPYPESVIGVYRARWYLAERFNPDPWDKHYSEFARLRPVDEFQYDTRKIYTEFTNMFCGKDGYSNHNQYKRVKVRSIVIVIVDERDEDLVHLLNTYHKPYILFCVILVAEREKIWIGFDTRRSKESADDYSYYDKIKELEYLLSD